MTPKEKNIFEWVAIGISCFAAPPIGFVFATAKVISIFKDKQQQRNRNQWDNRFNWQNQHYQKRQSSSDYAAYTGQNQSTTNNSAEHYSQHPGRNPVQNPAYTRMMQMNRVASPNAGRGLVIGGAVTAGLFGFCGLMELFDGLTDLLVYGYYSDFLTDLFVFGAFAAAGGVMIYFGKKKRDKARQYRKYLAFISDKNLVNLRDIARTTGTDYNQICEDVTDLLMKGTFGNSAYIDYPSGYLVLNTAGASALNDAQRRQAEAQRSAEEARRVASMPKDPADEILAEIRKVNDEIPDQHLSEQIDRIEEITRLILQCQKEHPEKEAQLHSFLSYYLPTTLKILRAYADMEKQSVQGKNITDTKARIEGMMDKVVHGFEVQLDQLFAADYMDISSDITVLENMMAQDGLTSGFPGTTPQGQTSPM